MSKHQGFSAVALVIILAVLAVGGYAVWKDQLGSEASKSDETAGWKTYRNEKYGFEFKYPVNWCVFEEGQKAKKDENCGGSVSIEPIPAGELSIDTGKPLIDSYNPITVGGRRAGETGWSEAGPDLFRGILFADPSISVFLSSRAYTLEKIKEIGNQILSTFRFIK